MSRDAGSAALVAVLVAFALSACDTPAPTASDPPGTRADGPAGPLAFQVVSPPFDPAGFVASITNPYLPQMPGTVHRYRSETRDGIEINTVRVTRQHKLILGVNTTVVHDQVFLNGELTEDTFDWEAQDAAGNVWYFGEDSKELENGQVVSTEGSWQAGANGAHAGIIMLAHPETGRTYVQEDAPDVAEDRAKALSLKAKVSVPYGSFEGCLETMEWTLIEHGDREHKFYCPGVGLVEEAHPQGGRITNELVSITHS
jgi:hypothetical protein